MSPYVRNHHPECTQAFSRIYAIMIPFVCNHDRVRAHYDTVRTQFMIPYVRNYDPIYVCKYMVPIVRRQSLSLTHAMIISYVRNHDPIYAHKYMIPRHSTIIISYARIIISYELYRHVRNKYFVHTQSLFHKPILRLLQINFFYRFV